MDSTSKKLIFFSHEFTVSEKDTDQNGHVNNVVYVQWMQDIAIMHSTASGGTEAMRDSGCSWVVRSHKIEYLNPSFAGNLVEATTWVAKYHRVKAIRQYQFLRKSDEKILAKGETEWVCVDSRKGKPRTIPENVQKCFHPADDS